MPDLGWYGRATANEKLALGWPTMSKSKTLACKKHVGKSINQQLCLPAKELVQSDVGLGVVYIAKNSRRYCTLVLFSS